VPFVQQVCKFVVFPTGFFGKNYMNTTRLMPLLSKEGQPRSGGVVL
jgi:hypothetical protein